MKHALLFLTLFTFNALFAQEDMSAMWSVKLDHKAERTGTDAADGNGISYAATDKEITVFENATGKVVWTKPFKEIAPRLKKIDAIIPIWEAKRLFLLDLKGGREQVAVIEMSNGNLLWESDQYKLKQREMISYIKEENGFLFTFKDVNTFVNADTGAELWSTAKFRGTVGKYFYEDGKLTTINFIPSGFMAMFSGFKNQIAQIEMKTGEIIWENTYIGRAGRKVVTREFMYDLEKRDGHLILHLNGLQVYDYKTGATLWSAAFNYEVPVKKPGNATKFGVYGAIAAPIFTDDYIYVIDMGGKKQQFVHKYQRKTGKLVWTSQEIKGGARAVPNMYVVDGKVILQIGGVVEAQGIFKVEMPAPGGGTYTQYIKRVYDTNVKPYGVQAFSDEDGRLVWDSERFKKGITNMLMHDEKNLIVCSGKALYSIQVHGGDVNYEVEVKNGGVGNAVQILYHNDDIVVVGEKGVSTFTVADGKLVAANKYKRASVVSFKNGILILETEKNDVAAFDVAADCKYFAYNAKKGAHNVLTTDGEYLYVYEGKLVSRLHTRK